MSNKSDLQRNNVILGDTPNGLIGGVSRLESALEDKGVQVDKTGNYATFAELENAIQNNLVDPSDVARLSEDNRFTGSNTFAGETTFSNGLGASNNIAVTDAVFKALDTDKDMVTQYAADEIVRETGTGDDKQTYNYKFPDKSGTLVVTEDISYLTLPSYIEITPNTAVNGTLSQEVYDILSEHHDVQIKLNNEYYICMDDGHTEGLMSYIHEGWNGKANQTKSINITKATKAWTLVVGENKHYNHHIQLTSDGKTLYYDFGSSQKEPYTVSTLPAMPDNVITSIQVVASGYYSSVSGLVYRNGDGALKVIVHGMYTSDGSTMSYLALTGTDAVFVSDTVVAL